MVAAGGLSRIRGVGAIRAAPFLETLATLSCRVDGLRVVGSWAESEGHLPSDLLQSFSDVDILASRRFNGEQRLVVLQAIKAAAEASGLRPPPVSIRHVDEFRDLPHLTEREIGKPLLLTEGMRFMVFWTAVSVVEVVALSRRFGASPAVRSYGSAKFFLMLARNSALLAGEGCANYHTVASWLERKNLGSHARAALRVKTGAQDLLTPEESAALFAPQTIGTIIGSADTEILGIAGQMAEWSAGWASLDVSVFLRVVRKTAFCLRTRAIAEHEQQKIEALY